MFHPGQLPESTKLPQRRIKKKRRGISSLLIFATTTAMVVTGGFGVFPDNPLIQMFQGVISESVSADFLEPFNSYMEVISAPTIQPKPDSVSTDASTLDPLGWLEALFAVDSSLPVSQVTEEFVNVETAVALIEEAQTQFAITQSALPNTPSPTLTQTQTSTSTLSSLPTATQSMTPTWTVSPVIIFPTDTKKPQPTATNTATATNTHTATATASPTCSQNLGGSVNITFTNLSSTETVTRYWVDFSCNLVSPTVMAPGVTNGGTTTIGHSYRFVNTTTGQLVGDYVVQGDNYTVDVSTGTATPPPGATEGSCVSTSPDTSTYGCQISNIRLDGVVQSSLSVAAPNQPFTLQYDYQTWSDPACPTCTIQLIAGMESDPASNCDYGLPPGAYPGANGTSIMHNLTAPSSSGTWAIFIRWHRTSTCDTFGYSGFGTVIANVIVP